MKNMTNWTVLLVGIMLTCPSISQAYWGVGTNLGYGIIDTEKIKTRLDLGNGKVTQGLINPDFNIFYEHEISRDYRIGFSLGLGMTSPVKYEFDDTLEAYDNSGNPTGTFLVNREYTNKTLNIPVMFYGKWKASNNRLNLFGGIGADYLSVNTNISPIHINGDVIPGEEETLSYGFYPCVVAGGEYFIAEHYSLGLNLKYYTGSATDGFGEPYDFSGARVNLAMRYYFAGLKEVATNNNLKWAGVHTKETASAAVNKYDTGFIFPYSIPMGAFKDTTKSAWGYGYYWDFNANDTAAFGAEISQIGYIQKDYNDSFFGPMSSDPGALITNYGLRAKFAKRSEGTEKIKIYGILGIGYYSVLDAYAAYTAADSGSAAPLEVSGVGVNIGGGLDIKLTQQFLVGFDLRYHMINKDYSMLNPGLKLTYIFGQTSIPSTRKEGPRLDEIKKAKELLDTGAINADEYEKIKKGALEP